MHSLPIGYLITALLVAVATLSSLAPRRLGILGPLRLYLGHVNELPFLAILWLLISTWIAFSESDIQSPVGWLALGLSVLSIGGLVLVAWRAVPTASVTSHALDEGLGTGWQSKIPAVVAARLHPMSQSSSRASKLPTLQLRLLLPCTAITTGSTLLVERDIWRQS